MGLHPQLSAEEFALEVMKEMELLRKQEAPQPSVALQVEPGSSTTHLAMRPPAAPSASAPSVASGPRHRRARSAPAGSLLDIQVQLKQEFMQEAPAVAKKRMREIESNVAALSLDQGNHHLGAVQLDMPSNISDPLLSLTEEISEADLHLPDLTLDMMELPAIAAFGPSAQGDNPTPLPPKPAKHRRVRSDSQATVAAFKAAQAQALQAPSSLHSQPDSPRQPGGQPDSGNWKRAQGQRPDSYKCRRCGLPKKNHICSIPDETGSGEAAVEAAQPKALVWTITEDSAIFAAVKEHGPRWALIAAGLPGRTDNAVRNRWHRLEKAHKQRLAQGEDVGYRCRRCGLPKKGHSCVGLAAAPVPLPAPPSCTPQPTASTAAGLHGDQFEMAELEQLVLLPDTASAPPPAVPGPAVGSQLTDLNLLSATQHLMEQDAAHTALEGDAAAAAAEIADLMRMLEPEMAVAAGAVGLLSPPQKAPSDAAVSTHINDMESMIAGFLLQDSGTMVSH